jgi:hypothetical protein
MRAERQREENSTGGEENYVTISTFVSAQVINRICGAAEWIIAGGGINDIRVSYHIPGMPDLHHAPRRALGRDRNCSLFRLAHETEQQPSLGDFITLADRSEMTNLSIIIKCHTHARARENSSAKSCNFVVLH